MSPTCAIEYVTRFREAGLIATITDIHFLSVCQNCTHALPRNAKYLIIDGQKCYYRWLFTDSVEPRGCISWPCRALTGLHRVKMTVLTSLVDCISLYHIVKAQHCSLSLNGCFNPPMAPHLAPTPTPSHPPTPYRLNL